MTRDEPDNAVHRHPPKDYPAEKARQGSIILRATWQRAIFFGGLIAIVIAALLWGR